MPEHIPIKAQLLTVRQVALIIQVHPNTVMTYLAQGKLRGHNPNGAGPGKKGLRITVTSVHDYLKGYLIEAFDEQAFEAQVQEITMPARAKAAPLRRAPRGGSWVRDW